MIEPQDPQYLRQGCSSTYHSVPIMKQQSLNSCFLEFLFFAFLNSIFVMEEINFVKCSCLLLQTTESEELAMLSIQLASRFLFTVGLHTKKTLRYSFINHKAGDLSSKVLNNASSRKMSPEFIRPSVMLSKWQFFMWRPVI